MKTHLPLHGRLILDCSALLPGPFIGKLLAEMGARVIKVENPFLPDGARAMGSSYQNLNECKERVELNLKDTQDRQIFDQWVAKAHGLIEGFRPQAKIKLGLDEATLLQTNPKLCITSLVGYPEKGPKKDRAGHDLNFSAATGLISLFNEMPALPMADLFSAYAGAFAMAAALDSVARGGPGRRMVISMTETLESVQGLMIRDFRDTGQAPSPGQTLFSGKFPCYRIYSASDGRRIAVGAIEPKFWEKVCNLLGLSHLVGEGFATGTKGQAVILEVQNVFGSRPWKDWNPLFENADCCVEPVLDYSEVYTSGI
jgi:alpha-methylacyl-CoA racemase